MKNLVNFFFLTVLILLTPISAMADLIGTYEISYITNSVDQAGGWTSFKPAAPLFVGELGVGEYELKIVEGRLDGNPVNPEYFNDYYRNIDEYWEIIINEINPGYEKYESGFNSGHTSPAIKTGYDEPNQYKTNWFLGTYFWLGDSLNDPDGVKGSHGGSVGSTKTFSLESSTSLWFFWDDYWNQDNIGGITIELSQISGGPAPIPEPTTMLLLGAGLIGLAGLGRKRFFRKG
jgi:hypothetical protein